MREAHKEMSHPGYLDGQKIEPAIQAVLDG
jgi:hypothetical protein